MTNYNKQADDFLQKVGATIEIKLLGHFRYFDGDKESRDVYEITIKRGDRKPWVFSFGQSIANSKPSIDKKREKWADNDGRMISSMLAKKEFPYKPPTAYDVLACITKHDPGIFEDFCGDYGYDEDSRKAEKMYFDVQREAKECKRVFGDVINELDEIN
jgi:hypothetical protein